MSDELRCKYDGEELIGEYFEGYNGENYCCPDCCLDDLRNEEIVALCEDGRYYYNSDFYNYVELLEEIGEWA